VVAAFSIGLAALSFYRDANRSMTIRVSSAVVAVVMTGLLVWALWWGFELITKKS
jgi:multisubunit Na+/H+ antiporter MnhB subunit